MEQHSNVGRAGVPVHRHDGEQHQHGAEQRVEEEFEGGIDSARAAPDPDDEEHRNEPALEEQIEQHEIERGEGAHHQSLEHQKCDHVLFDAPLDGIPARNDADRHQAGSKDDERQRNAVDAHMVGDGSAKPGLFLHELKLERGRVEAVEQDQGDGERDQRGPQSDPARIALLGLAVARQRRDEKRADERQERGNGQDWPAHFSRSDRRT